MGRFRDDHANPRINRHSVRFLDQLNRCCCFLLPCLAVAQQADIQNSQLAVLEGFVVHGNTKEPVRKASVTLEVADTAHGSAWVATTDELGRFRFAEVKPGRYLLTVEKSGFLPSAYGANGLTGQRSLLTVAAGDRMQNLRLQLVPGAILSGHVVDADGDPIANKPVVLWAHAHTGDRTRISHTDETTTNYAGEYRFDGLPPGAYYVSAAAGNGGSVVKQIPVDAYGKSTNIQELTTFYPAALSLADAQPVRIESGQEVSGIDIRLQRGPSLSVKGRIAGLRDRPSKYSITAVVDAGMGWASVTGSILPNGEFLVSGLPPGKHSLLLQDTGPNGPQVIGKTEVTLADHDLTGIVITPFKPAQVRVHVVLEAEEEDQPLTAGAVFLNPAEDAGPMNEYGQSQPQNGTYILDNVSPGTYRLWFNNAAGGFLKSVQAADRVLNPGAIEVGEGAVLDLVMIFSKNGASITGDVQTAQDQLSEPVHVILLSEDSSEIPELRQRRAMLDQNLHFSISDLRSGKYLALATQDDDAGLWSNPDFLTLFRSKALELDLHEREQSTVHLKLIRKEETDDGRKRLGL